MPFVKLTTREPLQQSVKEKLARRLSDTMLDIEIGGSTDAARDRDWMWFRVLPKSDWAVGGSFGGDFVRNRVMCLAEVVVPEAFLNTDLKLEAIARITLDIKTALSTDPEDDGTGIWVQIVEVPRGYWGSGGRPNPLFELIDEMDGVVSQSRLDEMGAHFAGFDRMKDAYGIPK